MTTTTLTPETAATHAEHLAARASAMAAAKESGEASAHVRCHGIVSSAEAMDLAASLESNPEEWGLIEGAEYMTHAEAAVAARDAEIAEVRLIAQGLANDEEEALGDEEV